MDPLVIGRIPGCDITITDTSVSRQHAELLDLGDGRFQLRDLQSTNGTYFEADGKFARVSDSALVDRQTRVSIGDFETTIAELLDMAGVSHSTPGQIPVGPDPGQSPSQSPVEAAEVFPETDHRPPADPPPSDAPPSVSGGSPDPHLTPIPGKRPRPAGPPPIKRINWPLYGGIAAVVLIVLGGAGAWYFLQTPRDAFMYGCVERESEKTCGCMADVLEARLTPDEFKKLNAELSPIRNSADFETRIAGKLVTGGVVNAKVSATLIQAAAVCAIQ